MDRNRIFGGNPLAVILRLAIISLIVGIIMSALDIRPENLIYHVKLLVTRIYGLGFGAIEGVLGYLALGAVVVVPIWLIVRVVSGLRSRNDGRP